MATKIIEKTELCRDIVVESIMKRRAEIANILSERELSLKGAPAGKLRIDRKGNSLQYYHRNDPANTRGIYLNRKQDSFAAALAQKDYDRKLIRVLEVEVNTIDKFLAGYHPEQIDEIYRSLHDVRKPLIHPVILSDEDYIQRWINVEYEKKTFVEDEPDHYTVRGERVRSKSEIMIADTLSRLKVPYRYEYPVHITGLGTVHPDFTCLNLRQRKEYIWEHSGLMSDSGYVDYAVNKIGKYTLAGYYPGDNLILSFETASRPLSSRIIEHLVQKYLL